MEQVLSWTAATAVVHFQQEPWGVRGEEQRLRAVRRVPDCAEELVEEAQRYELAVAAVRSCGLGEAAARSVDR